MKRFSDILYFADGVEDPRPGLERAIKLSQVNQARLSILDVVPGDEAPQSLPGRPEVDLAELRRAERQRRLERLIEGHGSLPDDPGVQVVTGIGFVEVIRAVSSEGHDLVMKDANPPDSFVKRTLGSTDLHLLRKCPCPIWIERPDAALPYRTLMAAVDPEESGDQASSRLIMDLATSLAERESARLAIVHAWELQGEQQLRGEGSGLTEEEVDLLVQDTEARHRQRIGSLLAGYGITPEDDRLRLVKGNPAIVLRDMSRELNVDLVIMGTLGRPGVPGVFIGNTAEDVLQTTQASVLAIKPLGFVSPVTT